MKYVGGMRNTAWFEFLGQESAGVINAVRPNVAQRRYFAGHLLEAWKLGALESEKNDFLGDDHGVRKRSTPLLRTWFSEAEVLDQASDPIEEK